MGKLFLSVMYKGKLFKHTFIHEGIKRDCGINVLLTTKSSPNSQFVCNLNNGYLLIPSTVCPREDSAKIYLNIKGKEFEEKYKHTSFIIPIHHIASYDSCIDRNIKFEYTVELF